jgi:hypothetical protein
MPSAWIEHVKKYASENGVSYRQAMKDSKATYVSVAKPKAPPKPRKPPKPQEPKGPRGRPRKMKKYAELAGDAEAEWDENDPMNFPSVKKPKRKRRPKMKPYAELAGDAEAEWDENDPMNFSAVEKQEEMAPVFETPFKQPPTLFIPDPYIGRISKQKVGELASKLSAIKRQTKKPEKLLYKNPLLEREIKTQRAKKLKEEDVRLSKLQDKAIAKSEMEEMGRAEEIQQMERALIREKRKIKPLDIVAEKEKRRMARYKKESDKIIAKAKKDKEFEKIMKSYGVPKSRKQILEERAGDWSSEF